MSIIFIVHVRICVVNATSICLFTNEQLEPVALLLLSYRCIVTINVLLRFLTLPWVGLQYVSVVFPDHTHLYLAISGLHDLSMHNFIRNILSVQPGLY